MGSEASVSRQVQQGTTKETGDKDEQRVLRNVGKLRRSEGHLTSKRVQLQSDTTHVCNKTLRNYLNRNAYHYLKKKDFCTNQTLGSVYGIVEKQ